MNTMLIRITVELHPDERGIVPRPRIYDVEIESELDREDTLTEVADEVMAAIHQMYVEDHPT